MRQTDNSGKMNNRGGLPVKNAVTAIFILLSVYLLYIYHVAQNNLHDSEITGSRFKRQLDDKSNELQGLVAARDEFQERCEAEKRELNNRIKAINQKHSLLQSQNTEIEADFMKLKQDMENLRSEHSQTVTQHEQEYQELKQSKQKEITDLTDQLQGYKDQNAELQTNLNNLQGQMKQYENYLRTAHETIQNLKKDKQSLIDKNAELSLVQYQQQKQLELQKQNEENARKEAALSQQMKVVAEGKLTNDNAGNQPPQDHADTIQSMVQDPANPAAIDPALQAKVQADQINALNAQNQAKPPMNHIPADNQANNDENKELVDDNKGGADVNPADLQKGQILEPLKPDGGEEGEAGKRVDVNALEEQREQQVAGEDKQDHQMQHDNPLNLVELDGGNNQNNIGQQQPPNMDAANKNQDNEANLDDDQKEYYQEREDRDNGDVNDKKNVNDGIKLADDLEAMNVMNHQNRGQGKDMDEAVNAWQHYNVVPNPVQVDENNNDGVDVDNDNGNKDDDDDDMKDDKYDDNQDAIDENKDEEEEEGEGGGNEGAIDNDLKTDLDNLQLTMEKENTKQ